LKISGIPNYKDLDESGESRVAATRMEQRAQEPASGEMFDSLVVPLLETAPSRILEIGCGTAALSRRVARHLPSATVHATDKSEGMLASTTGFFLGVLSGGGTYRIRHRSRSSGTSLT
jgi:ubiquinone/menaquinone biosynthesis C-methylase UbiE